MAKFESQMAGSSTAAAEDAAAVVEEEPEEVESAAGAPGRKPGGLSLPCFPRKGDVLAGVDEDQV